MNADRTLLALAKLAGSHAVAGSAAARRARAKLAMVRQLAGSDAGIALAVARTAEALAVLHVLEHRGERALRRKRCQQLAEVRRPARRSFSDAQLLEALRSTGGSRRQAARLLEVQPSTITRRLAALRCGARAQRDYIAEAASR